MADKTGDRLAVLIDADNAQPATASSLMAEIGRFGNAIIRRAYGDWTTSNLNGWREHLHPLAIQPIQQFRLTKGKNSTDSALIIDAMDLLHGGHADGFCLVSSDSDFTRLATRIRESGLTVYGFGEKKTPTPFVKACNKFVYTEILKGSPQYQAPALTGQVPLKPVLVDAIADAAGDDGWALLAAVGYFLVKAIPEFDSRTYGRKKLSDLVRAQDYLDVKEQPASDGSPNSKIFVRVRDSKPEP